MTRRRTFALMVLALVLVFVLGSIATLANTRNQLIDDIDQGLADDLDISMQLYNTRGIEEIDRLYVFENLDVVNSPIATVVVDSPAARSSSMPRQARSAIRSPDPTCPPTASSTGPARLSPSTARTEDRSIESPWGDSTTADTLLSPSPSTRYAQPSAACRARSSPPS